MLKSLRMQKMLNQLSQKKRLRSRIILSHHHQKKVSMAIIMEAEGQEIQEGDELMA